MKICRFNQNRLGVVEGDTVADVSAALDALHLPRWPYPPGDPLLLHFDAVQASIIEALPGATRLDIDRVQFNSPITCPTKIMAVPANYRKHVEVDVNTDPGVDQGFHAKQLAGVERPIETYGLFIKANSSIVGPSEGITRILPERRTDHEIELCCIIGRKCRSVRREEALDHVAGYILGLDITIRGAEERSYRKSADTYTVLGPFMTTSDEIRDPADVEIWLEVNGRERQRSLVSAMTVDFPDIIAFASQFYTLYPGDVIMSGTPEGVGPIEAGDVISAGGTGLGRMTARVS